MVSLSNHPIPKILILTAPYGTVNVVVAISALHVLSEYARTVCGPPV